MAQIKIDTACPVCEIDGRWRDTSSVEHRVVHIEVNENAVRFKFIDGSGIVIRRDNSDYLYAIGKWFAREVVAMPRPKPPRAGV